MDADARAAGGTLIKLCWACVCVCFDAATGGSAAMCMRVAHASAAGAAVVTGHEIKQMCCMKFPRGEIRTEPDFRCSKKKLSRVYCCCCCCCFATRADKNLGEKLCFLQNNIYMNMLNIVQV